MLPGAADRGDFDPTSSTVALSPGGLLHALPRPLVQRTFERYWRNFQARRSDEAAGVRHGDGAYTPYEWRNVGAFVRLGERERAQEAMAYFNADRRPQGWNQWAEVVVRDAREPRFLGDMPHGWVASDQIRSVLDLFAYEDEGESIPRAGRRRAHGLAAGGKGLSIRDLRTPWGRLSWSARAGADGAIDMRVSGLRSFPRGGVTLRGPWGRNARVTIDGRITDVPGGRHFPVAPPGPRSGRTALSHYLRSRNGPINRLFDFVAVGWKAGPLISIRGIQHDPKDLDPDRRNVAGGFVWLNWSALSAATPISLGWTTVQAPLGLVLLVPLLVLCVLLPAWAISLHARVLRDVRVITKALQQRELADREEAARLVDLRIDFLRALEEGVNTTAAEHW